MNADTLMLTAEQVALIRNKLQPISFILSMLGHEADEHNAVFASGVAAVHVREARQALADICETLPVPGLRGAK
jgi:hypothetical protein